MDIALAVGGSFLSAILQVAFDRIASIGSFPDKRNLQLRKLELTLTTISMVLEDAENKQARSEKVRSWLNSLKYAVHQADDVLDEINTERMRIKLQHPEGATLSDTDFSAQFIEESTPRLYEISDILEKFISDIKVLGLTKLAAKQKSADKQPSSSVVIKSQIFGRDGEKEKIIQMVLCDNGASVVSVIPITGLGGVGKTTLAQLVFNDDSVNKHFDKRAWVCVSNHFDVHRITKNLLMEVNSSVVDDNDDLNRLQVKLRDNLEGKRFLIILDDIWNDNYIDCQLLMTPLNSGSRGSKIIVTTRNEGIALMLQNEDFHCVQRIDPELSWTLFKLHAFGNGACTSLDNFETIGREIVAKCEGLPLAIKAMAGALRSKRDTSKWQDILSSEIWMAGSDVLPALSLSYEVLPSHLKCCFAFCAVFHKDIPFDKEEVVLLWMANDLVHPSTIKVGRTYFEELISQSFFELVEGNKYLMHGLVNDLARYVSGNFSVRIDDYQSEDLIQGVQGEADLPPEVLHFSYLSNCYDPSKSLKVLDKVQNLRTFLPCHQSWFMKNNITESFFTKIIPRFRRMRALTLSEYNISVVPDSVGDLTHLRFLNLARTSIKSLPDAIGKCLNLQTLILKNCYNLEKLPEDMRLLINLQHLDVRGVANTLIDKMASWLSILKDIQNISIVVDEIRGCNLEHLKRLQPLQFLKITGLENVVNYESVEKAELNYNKCIENLILKWSGIAECSKDERNIFAKLQPHTTIKQLHIEGYRGTTFSDWLGDYAFNNIEYLSLKDCNNCFSLPPLGQLTALKKLQISGMNKITKVCKTFYGNSSISKPFQSLQELRVSDMAEWKTWETHPDNIEFASLQKLCISDCPVLVGNIPFYLTSLREVEINNLPCLEFNQEGSRSLPLQSSSVKQLVIGECKHVKFPTIDNCNSCLESLEIQSCDDSVEPIPLFSFSRLRELSIYKWESRILFKMPNGYHQTLAALLSLEIYGCNNILSFPEGGFPAPNLKVIQILYCNKLKSLPEQMHQQLSSLHHLLIHECPEIECFPEGGLPSSLESLGIQHCKKMMISPRNWGLQTLLSLAKLYIYGVEDELFPEEGLLPNSLRNLTICEFPNLKTLNDKGLQHLTSLQSLSIDNCPNLESLSEDVLRSSLCRLNISDCPKMEACGKKVGEENSNVVLN